MATPPPSTIATMLTVIVRRQLIAPASAMPTATGLRADVDCAGDWHHHASGDACNDGDRPPSMMPSMLTAAAQARPPPAPILATPTAWYLCRFGFVMTTTPALLLSAGDACNDGNNTTVNDVIDANCNCAGTPTACRYWRCRWRRRLCRRRL